MSAWYRRFEVWVVAGFIALGAGYLLLSQALHDRLQEKPGIVEVVLDPTAATTGRPAQPGEEPVALPFAIAGTTWKDGGEGYWLLELRVRYRNGGTTEETLAAPKVNLLTPEGKSVEPYFLATEWPPKVPSGAEETVDLRYWMDSAVAKGALMLQIDGDRAPVLPPPAG